MSKVRRFTSSMAAVSQRVSSLLNLRIRIPSPFGSGQPKAELVKVNYLPEPILLIKKLEIEKIKTTFIISVLKVVYYSWPYLFQNPTFLLIKIPSEGN